MFDKLFTYHSPHPEWQVYIIMGVGIFLVLLAVWFMYRNPRRWWLRLPLYLLAILSLVIIGLAPETSQSLGTKKAILATAGTSPLLLDSLQKTLQEEALIYTLTDSSVNETHITIPNLAHLASLRQDIDTLWIMGNGLTNDELPYLQHFNTQLVLNAPPTGIQQINWTRHLQEGETLVVEGRFLNQEKEAITLQLEGLGETLESLSIAPNKSQTFRFKTPIKVAGNYLFSLSYSLEEGNIQKEQIPFIVYPLKKDKQILILLNQPSFETRFLKKHLAEKGYPVAIQSQISKEQFHSEYLNLQQSGKFLLNAESIAPFNLIILDYLRAQQLNQQDLSILKNHINETGAAVLTLVDEQALAKEGNPSWLVRFPNQKSFRSNGQEALLQIPATKYPIELPVYQIAAGFNVTPISTTQKGQAIVAMRQYGLGKYAVSFLGNSYLWKLKGYNEDYALFWDTVLEALESHYSNTSQWHIQEPFPLAQRAIHFKVQNEALKMPELWLFDGTQTSKTLPLAQSVDQKSWTGKTWLEKVGWHQLQHNNGSYPFYVYPTDAWSNYYTQQKIAHTIQAQQALKQKNTSNPSLQIPTYTRPISLFFWYILFVFTLFLLWIIAKFQSFDVSSRRIN